MLNVSDLTTLVRFLYNGELGVVTDDNTLLYMRQRYYDTEIKRFINQDILTGSIGDSQSLNRYAYVQGNPVSYSDPFGLSPFERLRQAFRPLHAVLNIAGIIPGPVGMLASLAQAGSLRTVNAALISSTLFSGPWMLLMRFGARSGMTHMPK